MFMTQTDPTCMRQQTPGGKPSNGPDLGWWPASILVTLVILVGYGIAPTRLPLKGEETCRALHGIEMARSGDWLIATNQGVPILDRPPMQYWTLALIERFVHPLDPGTLRWSMVATTLATALLILWYGRRFLSPTASLCAAVAYATMGHVLDLGRRVESDALFTLLLVAALLTWHVGYERGVNRCVNSNSAISPSYCWGRTSLWLLAASLAALATLTKGLQGPVAFFGASYGLLFLRRDWRSFFGTVQLFVLVVFFGLIAIWQVPFFLATGWEGTRSTWFSPGGSRLSGDAGSLLVQFTSFPFKVLGALLPWSPLLLGLFDPHFWRERWPRVGPLFRPADSRFQAHVLYLLLAVAAIFVPVWISSGGHQRYVMPMYPLVALLCGAVVDRALALDLSFSLRRFWRDYTRIVSVSFVIFAVVLAAVSGGGALGYDDRLLEFAQPWWLVALLFCASVAGAWFVLPRAAATSIPTTMSIRALDSTFVPVVLALLTALVYVGPYLNVVVRNSIVVEPKIVALRSALPLDRQLVSFGPLRSKFIYWYGAEIPIVPFPTTEAEITDDVECFAVFRNNGCSLDLPFRWEQLAELNMDAMESAKPRERVVVGRRLR